MGAYSLKTTQKGWETFVRKGCGDTLVEQSVRQVVQKAREILAKVQSDRSTLLEVLVKKTPENHFDLQNKMVVEDLTKTPDRILTNNPSRYKQSNISHNEVSVVLLYGDDCGHCRKFKPTYEKTSGKFPRIKFYMITNDGNSQHLTDAIEVLTKKCKDWNGGIPCTMVFRKNKLLEYKLGNMDETDFSNFLRKTIET